MERKRIHEQDLHWVSKITGQMIRGEVERNKMKYRNITKDGRVVWCECFNSVLKDKNGNVKTIMSLVQDITEQKEMEGQRNNFLSVASHELNTPVTTIKAYGQLAESMLLKKGDAETLNVIKRMGTQVNRLSILIGNLLDFTKIQKGKLKYNEDFFNFNDLVKEVIDDMQKISLTHKIKRNRGKSAQFFGDKDKIGQVLTNLISNAIKFSRNADSIFVNTKLQKNGIQISVQDYGIGISTKNRENVFQQFYRVTTSGDSHKTFPGMGIGLYVCSDIIARVGGKL
jgi:signal transduction histidine kinase